MTGLSQPPSHLNRGREPRETRDPLAPTPAPRFCVRKLGEAGVRGGGRRFLSLHSSRHKMHSPAVKRASLPWDSAAPGLIPMAPEAIFKVITALSRDSHFRENSGGKKLPTGWGPSPSSPRLAGSSSVLGERWCSCAIRLPRTPKLACGFILRGGGSLELLQEKPKILSRAKQSTEHGDGQGMAGGGVRPSETVQSSRSFSKA